VFWGLMAVLVLERAPSTRGRWAIVAATAIVVAVVGYTRVYLGHHWPSDVLGGWLAGWAWLGALLALRRRSSASSTMR
jgi:undecaprenyl-diphosphatase